MSSGTILAVRPAHSASSVAVGKQAGPLAFLNPPALKWWRMLPGYKRSLLCQNPIHGQIHGRCLNARPLALFGKPR